MIRLEHVSKVFAGENQVHAVEDVSLTVAPGEIFGIVGFSGAGKSTLVRCMNLLERPTAGRVFVDGQELTALRGARLNRARKKIGMIFQQFNLFATRTALDNVAFPLRHTGLGRRAIREKAAALLRFVELGDKLNAYPAQLSGGQKQRVAIARALACDPQVLLCDEATSALDPQTTASILALLKRLNRETGITIVVITHQMQVVKDLCQRVAVMEGGRVVEEGDIYSIFANPQQPITQSFVQSAGSLTKINDLIAQDAAITRLQPGECIIRLKYLENSACDALVSRVSREYQVNLNIIFGSIELIDDHLLGALVVIAGGPAEKIAGMIAFLRESRVEVEVLSDARIA